jgi:hypothetical protein
MMAFLPILTRVWPYLAGAAAIIGALFWIDARGYQRAKDDRAKADAALVAKIATEVAKIDTNLSQRIATIDTTERTVVQPTLIREIASAPRYRDPACNLTDDGLRAINTARAATATGGNQ